jgi:hypothetical protein
MTPKIELNDNVIKLDRAGKDWTGSDSVNVTDTVEIHCKVRGVEGEDWTVTVTTDCSNGATPDKIFSHTAPIPSGSQGTFEFIVTSLVPAIPCNTAK